MMKAIRYKRRI